MFVWNRRRRRRRLLKQLRENIRAMGNPQADTMTDDQLEKLATRFGTLQQMVAITDPAAKLALDFQASMSRVNATLSREDVRSTADDIRRLVEEPKPAPQTHDEAGDLILLKGGPMDGYLVRDGAPALFPGWSTKGAYMRSQPPELDEDQVEIATWVPS